MSINKVFDVALDIKRPSSHKDFTVINGDTGNRINIALTDGDQPVNISACRVIAAFSRPDGSTSLQDSGMQDGGVTIGGAAGNEVYIQLFPASFSPGMVECELQIYSDSTLSTLVTTARFNFSCRKAIMNEDTVQASPEYPLLRTLTDELKNSANGLSELMAEAEAAETARTLAEAKREEAAARFTNLSAEVTMLSSGAAPTASVTDTSDGKHISLGIPAGPKGDIGEPGPKGDTGEQGPQGAPGNDGANGVIFTPSVSEDGTLSWTNDGELDNPSPVNLKGPKGDTGDQGPQGEKGNTGDTGPQGVPGNDGATGATFIPAVAEDGTLSWSNDGEVENPTPVNLRGPKGDTGDQGPQGEKGDTGDTGPAGPKGDTGTGFAVLGYFETSAMLESAVSSPTPGDAYGVGAAQPYDIYIWDNVNSVWVNNGPLQGAKGDTGDTGPQGVQGNDGAKGATFIPAVAEDGTLSWSNDSGLENPTPVNLKGPKGDAGEQGPRGEKGDTGDAGPQGVQGNNGATGATFTPAVAEDGTLSWSNDGGLENPSPVNLKGPKGDTGDQGPQGEKGNTGDTGPQGIPGNDGANGTTFTPAVAEDGTLSWSNDGGLENPPSVNIMGPSGSSWPRESFVEPYYIEAQDGHEYYISNATELGVDLPTTDFYEVYIKVEWIAGDYTPFIFLYPEVYYIGGEPEWQSGFAYEISVKNGAAIAARVGEL